MAHYLLEGYKLMKKISIVIALITSLFSINTFAETLKLTNGEWPPFLSKDLKHYGVASHIVEEAFKNGGDDVKYGFFPWKRAFSNAKDGDDWIGSVIWSHSEERKADFLYSDPVIISKQVFFYRKDLDFDWNTYDDLGKYKIGAAIGYFYGEDIENAEKAGKLKLSRISKEMNNFKKLMANRLDLVVATIDVGYELLYKHFPPAQVALITNHPKVTRETGYHLIVSKKAPNAQAVIDRFNKGLKELKASGQYEKMMSASQMGGYKK